MKKFKISFPPIEGKKKKTQKKKFYFKNFGFEPLLMLAMAPIALLVSLFRRRRRRPGAIGTDAVLDHHPRRRRVDPAVDARSAFGLDPSLEIVLGMAPYAPTRAKPPNHHGYGAQNCYDGENSDYGPHRAVARMRGVGLLRHLHRRRL